MKFIILSGAGLSAPSGLPLYETLVNDANYTEFFESDAERALEIASDYFGSYEQAQPNAAHHECFKIQEFCKAFDIDFHHYTLNVDTLNEQAGCTVTHLYGCVDDLEDLVKRRKDVASVDLRQIDWQSGDVLIVLGVSNDGYPLAYLEEAVLSSGAKMRNYNIEHNADLTCEQVIGSVEQELVGVLAVSLANILFAEFPFDTYCADVVRFTLYNREYTTYFSPTREHRFLDAEIKVIERETGVKVTDRTSEVKFDLVENNQKTGESFVAPKDNFTLQELNILGFIIVTLICCHDKIKNVDMYTAAAVDVKLVRYYNRLAKNYAERLQYKKWCAFGPNGDDYAFKK